ncbi:hypothetical protein [Mycetocola spongiae]|uniref:hypothetical protein n=1 Tax=Mycetocola spongiae TaxID=2859226 RepID=UPI001CF5E0CB|nr:hypothetical protein [Mycetocola spongiae]UCR89688.1 hypothetical protein KXZ72_03130 [Mycetocola spongiae]
MISLFGEPEAAECSRAQCREAAAWRIEWRNPKIHDETRRKIWLACEEHREYLVGFLEARNFPVEALPFTSPEETHE